MKNLLMLTAEGLAGNNYTPKVNLVACCLSENFHAASSKPPRPVDPYQKYYETQRVYLEKLETVALYGAAAKILWSHIESAKKSFKAVLKNIAEETDAELLVAFVNKLKELDKQHHLYITTAQKRGRFTITQIWDLPQDKDLIKAVEQRLSALTGQFVN